MNNPFGLLRKSDVRLLMCLPHPCLPKAEVWSGGGSIMQPCTFQASTCVSFCLEQLLLEKTKAMRPKNSMIKI